MDDLLRIKRLVLRRLVRFTQKARDEMLADDLTREDVYESLLNAQGIYKTLRSRSAARRSRRERLYVIKSFNFDGTLIYTKGVIARTTTSEYFYVLVSAKVDTFSE
jgi:hypothetical protein